ncbi:MAG: hypothetical protein ACI88A_001902 [Paraglaciecola sp.]|jgi:hypothetical protein
MQKYILRSYSFEFRKSLSTLFLLIIAGISSAEDQQVAPPSMLFSYINHPYVIKHLIPTIEKSYALLGIKTEFVEQPSARNLRFVDQGITDGEVAYSDLLVSKYQNLLIVGPVLVSSVFVIICHESVTCGREVLNDKSKVLVLTDATKDGMEVMFKDKFEIELYLINRLNQIPQLLSEGRFQYGIYVIAKEEIGKIKFSKLNYEILFETQTHHIINRKYAHLANAISKAISQVLAEK